MISYCKECLYPSTHPLGITIGADGVCSGCRIHREKFSLDWKAKHNHLDKLAARYRLRKREAYDCIVPINAGSDTFFTVHYVKNILKLNPLCAIYNTHYLTALGHQNLARLRAKLNVDIEMHIPSLQQVKDITRSSLYYLDSIYWHVHAGHTAYPVHLALQKKIPLIIWGCHEAVDQVGMFSHDEYPEMTSNYRHNFHLMGMNMAELEKLDPILKKYNNWVYHYPDLDQLESNGIHGIYLSNYLRWDQKTQTELLDKIYGYTSRQNSLSYNPHENPHCAFYHGIHDWIKYLKYGYGRIVDHLVRDIRWQRLSRADAINILSRFHPAPPISNIRLFANFLSLQPNAVSFLLSQINAKGYDPLPFYQHKNDNITSSPTLLADYLNVKLTSSTLSTPHTLLPGAPY